MTRSWRMSRRRWFMYVHTVFLEWNIQHFYGLLLSYPFITDIFDYFGCCTRRRDESHAWNHAKAEKVPWEFHMPLRISSSWAWIISKGFRDASPTSCINSTIDPDGPDRVHSLKFRKVTDWDPFHGSYRRFPFQSHTRSTLRTSGIISVKMVEFLVVELGKPSSIPGCHDIADQIVSLPQAGGSFLAVWQVWLFHPVGDW